MYCVYCTPVRCAVPVYVLLQTYKQLLLPARACQEVGHYLAYATQEKVGLLLLPHTVTHTMIPVYWHIKRYIDIPAKYVPLVIDVVMVCR